MYAAKIQPTLIQNSIWIYTSAYILANCSILQATLPYTTDQAPLTCPIQFNPWRVHWGMWAGVVKQLVEKQSNSPVPRVLQHTGGALFNVHVIRTGYSCAKPTTWLICNMVFSALHVIKPVRVFMISYSAPLHFCTAENKQQQLNNQHIIWHNTAASEAA